MNLYIFDQTRRGTVFGVGTYIRELTAALKGSDVTVCVVHLISDKPQIETEEIDGTGHWYIPKVIADQRTTDNEKQWELYFRNVVYLLRLHIRDKKDLIFHLNFFESGKLAEELKNAFDCSIVAVSHFSEWGFTIFDNLERMRRIVNEENSQELKGVAGDPESSSGRNDREIKGVAGQARNDRDVRNDRDIEEKVKKSFEEEKYYYSKADRVICLSHYMQEILCRDYGLDAAKISVISNGLTDNFQGIAGQARNDSEAKGIAGQARNDSGVKSHLRANWNIPPKEKIILFAGRIDEVKGVSYLIKAFREVLKTLPDCRLIIAGSGDYDQFMPEAKDVCTKITFTGLLEKEELHEMYSLADVGVVPSLFEPFGFVAVEMMMHQLPVVATATSGLNEVVDASCGIKIPITVQSGKVEMDTSLLAQKMVYLLQNPADAGQMGQNGRKRYLEKYSSNVFRTNMLNVYQSLCRNRNDRMKALIVTGQSNHRWEVSHVAIKQILENSGLFTVDVAVSPKAGERMANFKPDFASYQLVLLDYNGDRWPEEAEKSFENYVENGGGVVVCHAANNAFRQWKAYNQIIGFGGWEGRDETDGPYMYMKDGKLIYDASPGPGGSHGDRHEFTLHGCQPEHPVSKGLPSAWRHAEDELYDRLRGPGRVKDALFWATSDPATRGSGREEVAIFTVDYGKARIFHTTLGHAGTSLDNNTAMQCAGFQVTLLRGAEWAATGKVTQPAPDDFPTATVVSLRKQYKQNI